MILLDPCLLELGVYSWAWMDLNHRPLPYQGSALTGLSYRPPGIMAPAVLPSGQRSQGRERVSNERGPGADAPPRHFFSASVISTPPTTSEMRL
jgi:hypothetical protein